jgi:membrane-associated protease RseP (regulator of RpoE activity)
MTTKYILCLLASTILTTGIALAQQSTTPAPPIPAEPFGQAFSLLMDGGGFLGVYAEDISRENMGRYNLNQVRGVGVTQIIKDSPAEKAGLRKDDVILRIDGENVTSVRKLNRLVSEIAPDQTIRVAISRGGSEQELTATIGKRENMSNVQSLGTENPQIWKWEGPLANKDKDMVFGLGNSRRIGVSTMELTKQLAEYFGIADGKGVLVTSVSADSPAAKAGIKAGDVITAIDGEKVEATGDISRAINNNKDGDVTLTIIRNRTQQKILVTPKEGDFPFGTPGARPQIGRRIVIPRIELPSIPEMNIMIPRIELPTIPSVDIQLPRVTPKVMVVKPAARPI